MTTTSNIQNTKTTALLNEATSNNLQKDANYEIRVAMIVAICLFGPTSFGLVIAGLATHSPALRDVGFGLALFTLCCGYQWARLKFFPNNMNFY